jgi:hypothetical protein
MPLKGLVRVLVLATFATPPFLGAMSWILLAGPNAGWLNRAYSSLFGVETGILNIYSFSGLVFIIALYSFPYAVVFTSSALDMVSSEMEDAANILGASRFTLSNARRSASWSRSRSCDTPSGRRRRRSSEASACWRASCGASTTASSRRTSRDGS